MIFYSNFSITTWFSISVGSGVTGARGKERIWFLRVKCSNLRSDSGDDDEDFDDLEEMAEQQEAEEVDSKSILYV